MPLPKFIELTNSKNKEEVQVKMMNNTQSTMQSTNEKEKTSARKKSTPTKTPVRTPVKTPTKEDHVKKSAVKAWVRKMSESTGLAEDEAEDDEDDDDEEIENEVALIRREYRVKQLYEQQNMMKKPPHAASHYQQNGQRNSISTRLSTPTYSSSLPSENSLSSPNVNDSNVHQQLIQNNHLYQQQQPTSPKPVAISIRPSLSHQSSNISGSCHVVVMSGQVPSTPSRLSAGDRFKAQQQLTADDLNNSFRRNSYTKAIFYENENL